MSHPIKKIVILTSGGDAPGMNAAIRAAVRSAIANDIEVFASENGYDGLVKRELKPLNVRSVANCIQRGGTILKTKRVLEFHEKSVRDQCRIFLEEQQIDGLIVLGGDGSFTGAARLQHEGGPRVIGIPCTIDNDIVGTEYCIGFDTACNTALSAIDKIRDTAFSLNRNFLIEVMGRASGFIAMEVGIAGGAEIILIPEFPMELDVLARKIKQQAGKKSASIIVAAESDEPGSSLKLVEEIKKKTGVTYKVCILGHTQRGGTPTAKDRVMGSLMGAKAVEALLTGGSCQMVAADHGKIITTNFPTQGQATRFFNDKKILKINQTICQI